MKRLLEDLLPIASVEKDAILSKEGDVTVGYILALPELFTLSEGEYEAFHQAWIKAIKILPTGTVVHKQDWFVSDQYTARFDGEEGSFLSRCSERHFHERPFLNHECYLYLTRKPAGRRKGHSLFSTLAQKNLLPKESLDPRFLGAFLASVEQCKRILEDSGFVQLRRLREEELVSQHDRAGVLERYIYLLDKREDRIIRDTQFKDGFKIGGYACQLYALSDVADLPSHCGSCIDYEKYSTDKTRFSTAFAAPLGLLLPCNHIYNQFLFIEDGAQTIRQLEAKKRRLQSLAAYSRENAIARDAVNDFLNEAVGGQRLPVKAHFNVLVWSDKEDGERELRTLVSSALARMDAVPKQEVDGAPQIYWAGLPGNEGNFPLPDTFDTFLEQGCCFLNLETAYKSSLSPLGIRLGDRLTGTPVHVDLSDEPLQRGWITNRNKFILGPSGSGKSFFTNHMVRSYYEQGTHIVLVDVGHSYAGLCRLLGGYYFTYEETSPIRFNPFYLPPGEAWTTEKKKALKRCW